jgi:threonine synthase
LNFFSTNKKSPDVDFKTATINGQAPDRGLYFPRSIPLLNKKFIDNIGEYSNEELAYEIIKPYVGDTIPGDKLKNIISDTINFDIPLKQINENIYSLELFHGPTLAFKDVGARFMSRCLGYFVKDLQKKVTVLVATSGDTGGAVANGFYDVPGIDVIILYPSGKVSSVQEKQLTTLGKNIHALEVDGSFDDCQEMVKEAFLNAADYPNLFLTSANSINVARWLPQQFYYLFAYKQWVKLFGAAVDNNSLPVISVPSGNFGNICAGLMAHASGLPVKHFIAACNANDVVPVFLQGGDYLPKKAVSTISNAMDVGNPSNFVRILEIFENKMGDLKNILSAVSINDADTKATLKRVYDEDQYLLDPHGAVAYLALQNYLQQNAGDKGLIVETAHPVKFYDVVEPVIESTIDIPGLIREQLSLPKKSTLIHNDPAALKTFLKTL